MQQRFRIVVAAVFLCVVPRAAFAHPAPYSYVDLDLRPDKVSGAVVLHVYDVAHELSIDDSEKLLVPATLASVADRVRELLRTRISLRSQGQLLAVDWQDVQTAADRHGVRVAFEAATAVGGELALQTVLFPYDPQHQTFVNMYEGGVLRHQAILDANHSQYKYFAGSVQGVVSVVRTFVPAGIHHILIGPDHVLFLVALVVLGGTLSRLLLVASAFTVGHSITLSLAATGMFMPPSTIIEPAIALTIVMVGVDNLMVVRSGNARDLRPWAALVFGLVHGFGFASVLREIGLPPTALGWSLFSFNVGVEIGQIAIVAVVAGVVFFLRRRSVPLAERFAYAASLIVVMAGAFWFAERIR